MKVRVTLFGTLRQGCPDGGIEVEMPGGATARDLLARLEIAPKGGIVSAEGVILKPDAPLPEGVPVSIFRPVSGG